MIAILMAWDFMTDMYEDMARLNALYEELMWDHDDELVFTHEFGKVVIYNKTQRDKNDRRSIR